MHFFDKSLVWFRRDLRAYDHAALHHALQHSRVVYCVFVFDVDILATLPSNDRRVAFIHASVVELDTQLRDLGGQLAVRHGVATSVIPALAAALEVDAVFTNHDYEPQAIARDATVAQSVSASGRQFLTFKDQLIFEKEEVLSLSGKPFSVFTPYKNAWIRKLQALQAQSNNSYLLPYLIEPFCATLAVFPPSIGGKIPTLGELGFKEGNLSALQIIPGASGAQTQFADFLPRMAHYDLTRDFPSVKGPSYLSVHLRFGTISIRTLVRWVMETISVGEGGNGAATWLSELIWREFYSMILYHHPRVVDQAFKPAYDAIVWESGTMASDYFQAWCEGRTGYPLVDAAMRQIRQSGYMHNRLRMVTACFLIKDLGIDWRWGERYFAQHLNDFDLASNNGGWQWAASSGCDAQPYFRIFNPITQSEKFDPEGKFIRRYLPQLSRLSNRDIHAPWLASSMALQLAGIELGNHYPSPIIAHDIARMRTMARYSVVKKIP